MTDKEMTIEELEELLKKHESDCLEFKQARENFDDDKLGEACSAMANVGGGLIVLGVDDRMPHHVLGSQAYRNPAKIAALISDRLKPTIRVQVSELFHPDGRVVCARVPSGEDWLVEYRGKAYTRIGARTVLMPPAEKARFSKFAKPVHWLDEACFYGVSPESVMDMLEVQRFYEMQKVPWPGDLNEVMNRLVSDGLLMSEDASQGYSITQMGALLLAKSFERFPSELNLNWKGVRIVKYKGKSNTEDILFDKTFDRGLATGFDDIIDTAISQMESSYERKGSQRHIVDFVPRDAVRELVANAIIHQNFSITKRVLLEIFNNRVKITNAGESLTVLDRMIDKNQTRNAKLLDVMRKCGLSEDLGTGIDKVVEAMENRHAPPPSFESQEETTEVTLFSEKFKMNREQMKTACYQHCVLKYVRKEAMTNGTLRKRLNLSAESTSTISKILSDLVAENKIKRVSENGHSKKFAKYVPHWADFHPANLT